MRKSMINLSLILIIFANLIYVGAAGFSKTSLDIIPISATIPADRPLIFVEPQLKEEDVGTEFIISVKIHNLTDAVIPDPNNPRTMAPLGDLYGVGIELSWNSTILEYVRHRITIPVEDFPNGVLHEPVWEYADDVDAVAGKYNVNYISLYPAEPFNNPGQNNTVFTMTFRVISKGACDLALTRHDLAGGETQKPILHVKWDGVFQTPGVPVATFSHWPTDAYAAINKPVMFNASASTSTPPGNIALYIWDLNTTDTTGAFRVSTSNPIVNFTYTNKGTPTVKLTVKDNNGVLSKPTQKKFYVVESRDVGITQIELTPNVPLVLGYNLTIGITLHNKGGASENFTISTYYNSTPTGDWKLIKQNAIINWGSGRKDLVIFKWNTSVLPEVDATYFILANLTAVPHEANVTNNNMRSPKPAQITTGIFHDVAVGELSASVGDILEPFIVNENVTIVFNVLANGTANEKYKVTLTVKAQDGSVLLTNLWENQTLEAYKTKSYSFHTTDLDAGNCTISVKIYVLVQFVKATIAESLYRDVDASDVVSVGDVRLTAVGSYLAGSTVASGDTDIGQSLIAFASNEKHRENIASNGIYDVGEFIYRDVDTSGNVTVGDIRLTVNEAYRAGSTVTINETDIGQPLFVFASNEKSVEDKNLSNNVKEKKVTVVAPPVLQLASIPSTNYVGDSITFDASASQHPSGEIVTYKWEVEIDPGIFGVIKTGSDASATYAFEKAGNWTVRLTVTDSFGLTYDALRVPATSPYKLERKVYVEAKTQGLSLETYVLVIVGVVAIAGAGVAFLRLRKPKTVPS